MQAIGYVRVSTGEQAESGLGLEAQRAAIAAWCAKNGAELVDVFEDAGVSGGADLDQCPGLVGAVDALDKGAVLVVAKRDRLGRDPLRMAMVERLATRAGARIVSAAGEGTETDDPTSVLMRRIVDAFGEYERMLIRARTSAALQAKRSRSERVGAVRYGYRLAEDGTTELEDADEQAVIAEVRRMRAAGLSLRAIAGELAAVGLVPRGGGQWAPTQIKRIAEAA